MMCCFIAEPRAGEGLGHMLGHAGACWGMLGQGWGRAGAYAGECWGMLGHVERGWLGAAGGGRLVCGAGIARCRG